MSFMFKYCFNCVHTSQPNKVNKNIWGRRLRAQAATDCVVFEDDKKVVHTDSPKDLLDVEISFLAKSVLSPRVCSVHFSRAQFNF